MVVLAFNRQDNVFDHPACQMLLRLPILFANIDLKIKSIACLCFTQHPQFDFPLTGLFFLYCLNDRRPLWGLPWSHQLKPPGQVYTIFENFAIQNIKIAWHDIYYQNQGPTLEELWSCQPSESTSIFEKKMQLCHDGTDTSLVDQVVDAPLHLNSWELDNSHIYQDANECLHFISRNRTPLSFVLVGLSCSLLLMVPAGFSDKELPHIICKHFRKTVPSLQSAG